MLINFLVQVLQSAETLILYLFSPWKYEKNTRKDKISEVFSTAKSCQSGQTVENLNTVFPQIVCAENYSFLRLKYVDIFKNFLQ